MIDWLTAIDPERALANCHTDIIGDWYRDPWGWPELDFVVRRRPDLLESRLAATGTRRVALIDVAKPNFGVRPAVVLDPTDRLAYQALVDAISNRLIGEMKPWVRGWRLATDGPIAGRYVANARAWETYRETLSELSGLYEMAITTDIVSFFASIPIPRLIEDVRRRARGGLIPDRLGDMLSSWALTANRSGLPQRAMPSSVLANMYLQPLHDVIGAEGRATVAWFGDRALQWMDDIWLFGDSEADLRRAQIRIGSALRDLGLAINEPKTMLLSGESLIKAAREIEHSAVDDALLNVPIDEEPLNDLVDRLLREPERAPRTSVRFCTTRMRAHRVFDRVDAMVANAPRMPHVADHLARLFRESGAFRGLEGWYIEHSNSAWATHDWSIAHLALMFPSSQHPGADLVDHMARVVRRLPSLSLLAVAAQRLAAWNPERARTEIRDVVTRAHHPLERRVFALAALDAGADAAFVRATLSQDEANGETVSLLEDRRYRPLDLNPDFAGG